MKPQTLSMIFQNYVNTTLISEECCPLTHVLWSRQKIPNLSKCVCDTDIWQGRSSAGVVQSDGGVKGKRKVVGTLGLEASLKWWNRSMSRRPALMAREISWQTVRRSLVSVTKCKLGCVTACVVTDWLMDERYFLARIYRTKNKMLSLYVHMSAAICLFVCQRANEAQYSVVCV